jgi:hypothetical protein
MSRIRFLYFSFIFVVFCSFLVIFQILNLLEVIDKDEPLSYKSIDDFDDFQMDFPQPNQSTEVLNLLRRLNLTNPGYLGAPVILPTVLDQDIQNQIEYRNQTYKFNEFVSSLIPLNRELPDGRSEGCKALKYTNLLPKASVVMVLHNEPLSMILRSIFSILNRSPAELLREITLIDDYSSHGGLELEAGIEHRFLNPSRFRKSHETSRRSNCLAAKGQIDPDSPSIRSDEGSHVGRCQFTRSCFDLC